MQDQLFDLFLKMAETQHAVNCQLVGAEDYYTSKYERIVYPRAIAVELGELYDHLGYKWWKKADVHFARARMEVIDLLHFELAKAIVDYAKTSPLVVECDEAVRKVTLDVVLRRVATDFASAAILVSGSTAREDQDLALRMVDNYAKSALADGSSSIRVLNLFTVAYAVGLTVNDMIAWYIGKASLNMFRNANGYTTGEYIKNWRYDDVEYTKLGLAAEGADDWQEDNDALEWTIGLVGRVTSFEETQSRITATLQMLYDVQLKLGRTRE